MVLSLLQRVLISAVAPALIFVLSLPGQPVRVVSEFVRFTPQGEIFPQDKVEYPIEVLSPALVRGVWNNFRIVVDAPAGEDFRLYVAQNPDNAMQVRTFRETITRGAGGWQVASREELLVPFRSEELPAAEREGQSCYTFWMALRPPVDYPSRRLKLEAQVLLDGHWFIYPLELRVLDMDLTVAQAASGDFPSATLQAATADGPFRDVLRAHLCGATETATARRRSPRAAEDVAATAFSGAIQALAQDVGQQTVDAEILRFLGTESKAGWCEAAPVPFARYGAEWPVVLRNRVLRLAGNPGA